ncbi:3-isopropylmalate dehydrogenase [Spirochaetia bacterium]|nr:3-isopropylmalate dehydrogenase [Spirochaetia bacterium]
MSILRTTDNNWSSYKIEDEHDLKNLSKIANKKIGDIKLEKDADFIVFPPDSIKYHDDIKDSPIFRLSPEGVLTTENIMGFVGFNDTQLTISSRFTQDNKTDYFLHYMLQKVLSINLVNLDVSNNSDSVWDFYLYLFPRYLNNALKQGLYKAYRHFEYNDANVKGTIDVKRHLRLNMPFAGKIAYKTKEFSYDNPVTQLIRHTIEYIKTNSFTGNILTGNSDVADDIKQIISATPSYNKNDRQNIISKNSKFAAHPLFTEYKSLQKISLNILRHKKLSFGNGKDKIYGLLFDGAWLWEEYLNTILKTKFEHTENKTGKGRMYLFNKNDGIPFQTIYPDFISKDNQFENKIVGDAKYIPLDKQSEYGESEKATSIYYKTITYLYRLNSKRGFLFFPTASDYKSETYKIIETDGSLTKIGFTIPQGNKDSFGRFRSAMEEAEKQFVNEIDKQSKNVNE